MRYLILTDHPSKYNDLRVSKSQKYLVDSKTLYIPPMVAKFFWVPGYTWMVWLITLFYRFDALYCHDLFLSCAGVKRWRRKKVICDLHENFYDCFNHARFRFRFLKWFFRPARINRMIRKVKKHGTIVTVTKGIADMYGTDLYYPNVGVNSNESLGVMHKRLVFIGRDRGLKDVDHDIYHIKSECTVFLKIRGIGLLPNPDNPQNNHASPNKLFCYMNSGMPVVCASHMREVVKVIDKYGCGYYEDTIDQAIKKAMDDPYIGIKADNAKRAVIDEYNEENLVVPFFKSIQ